MARDEPIRSKRHERADPDSPDGLVKNLDTVLPKMRQYIHFRVSE
jgi:hypothetical protein